MIKGLISLLNVLEKERSATLDCPIDLRLRAEIIW